MNYFGARYYDSDLGRWTSVDPLAILRPGLSSYNYVQNNPLFRIDPFGLTDTTYTAEIKNDIVITSNDQANSPLYYYNTNSTCATSAQNKHYNEDNLSGTLSLIGFGIGTAYKSTENYTVSKMARSPYKINRLRIGNYYNQIYLRPLRIAGRVILVAGVVGDLTNLSQTGDWQSALIGLGVTGITAINLPLGGFYFVVDETIGWDSVHQSIEKIDNFRQNYGYPLNGLR